MICYKSKMDSPLGPIELAANDQGLVYCASSRENGSDLDQWLARHMGQYKIKDEENQIIRQAKEQLQEYFAGERREFDLPLLLIGTDFRKKVWEALKTIPYGESRSYGEIAKKIGKSKASRAIGQANHHNPISYFVP